MHRPNLSERVRFMDDKASLGERVYHDLKDVICNGGVLPGGRVDVAEMCNRFGASRSPVRQALSRLVGEGLLELHSHDGYYRPRVTPQNVRDLYDWNEAVLTQALVEIAQKLEAGLPLPALEVDCEDVVATTEIVFVAIAAAGGNTEYVRAIGSNNDRLRAVRLRKASGLFDRPSELRAFVKAWSTPDIPGLTHLVAAYHARRRGALSDIVVAAYSV